MHCARHFGIHLMHSLMIQSKISICNRMERLLTILKCKQLGIALKNKYKYTWSSIMIRVIYFSDFSPSLSREDTQKYLAINGKTLLGIMDFFSRTFLQQTTQLLPESGYGDFDYFFFQENDEKNNFKTMNVLCFLFFFYYKTHQLTKIHPKKH